MIILITGCGSEDKDPTQRASAAGGQILERSITDEMLPYDTVTSQAPRAKAEKDAANGDANAAARPDEE